MDTQYIIYVEHYKYFTSLHPCSFIEIEYIYGKCISKSLQSYIVGVWHISLFFYQCSKGAGSTVWNEG